MPMKVIVAVESHLTRLILRARRYRRYSCPRDDRRAAPGNGAEVIDVFLCYIPLFRCELRGCRRHFDTVFIFDTADRYRCRHVFITASQQSHRLLFTSSPPGFRFGAKPHCNCTVRQANSHHIAAQTDKFMLFNVVLCRFGKISPISVGALSSGTPSSIMAWRTRLPSSALGLIPSLRQISAAIPAACPVAIHIVIMRTAAIAWNSVETQRPATNRLSTFSGTMQRYGTSQYCVGFV